ncbi:MAG TPA: glycoside hydrolase family 15 protein [Acidimicrobiales bacterium]|nr:glycoside hydrolase family 15 protein [Acidimicrobiales bacterium]
MKQPSPPHVLREYAIVADGERGGLFGPTGSLVWLCFPRFDDPALFSALIGGAGEFAVQPQGRFVWGGYYEDGSLIWRNRWVTADGSVVECREALALPSSVDTAVILRRVRVETGTCDLEINLNPRADYGKSPLRRWRRDGTMWQATAGGVHLRMRAALRLHDEPDGHGGRRLCGAVHMEEGEQHDLVLELSTDDFSDDPPDADISWERTTRRWKEWLPTPDTKTAGRDARHACAVLRGLTSSSGAMVAALTTSLPERADRGRDYDYRYCWIRDVTMAALAVDAAAPQSDLVEQWGCFVRDRVLEHGRDLAPAYRADGRAVPAPTHLELPGYPGGHDVVGNQVRDQFQLDIFGDALLLFAVLARRGALDGDGWRAAELAVQAIAERWDEPDSGIWETDPQWFAASRLTCVAGLRALAAAGASERAVAEWTALADRLVAETTRRCTHPSGRLQRAEDDERIDAGLLVPLLRGALSADDPRVRATVDAVRDELTVDGYVYRYRVDSRPLGDAEGAFLLCGFLMARAELLTGDPVASARWFERTRASCGPPGLYSEEFDVGERQLRGNLPQAFVHALMLEAAAEQEDGPVS